MLAWPCNQFGNQEPGDSRTISEFVKSRCVLAPVTYFAAQQRIDFERYEAMQEEPACHL